MFIITQIHPCLSQNKYIVKTNKGLQETTKLHCSEEKPEVSQRMLECASQLKEEFELHCIKYNPTIPKSN